MGSRPFGVAVNPAGTRVYVTNNGGGSGNTVSVIDTARNSVIATVPVGAAPTGVAINPAGTRVYVGNINSFNVSVIDTTTNTVIATVPGVANATSVAVNSSGTQVFVTNPSVNNVSIIDAASNTVSSTVAVADPRSVALNPVDGRAYISNQSSDTITSERILRESP